MRPFKRILILIIFCCNIHMQAQTIRWTSCVGGTGTDIPSGAIKTADGGFIVLTQTDSKDFDCVGNTGGTEGNVAMFLFKFNSAGVIQWKRLIRDFAEPAECTMLEMSNQDILIVGTGYISTLRDQDIVAVRISAAGSLLWQKNYGGSGREEMVNHDFNLRPQTTYGGGGLGSVPSPLRQVEITTDGGFIFASHTTSRNNGDVTNGFGSVDVWVVKCTSNGIIQWQRSLGGTSSDKASGIRIASDGGYAILATSLSVDGTITAPHAGKNVWLIKLNSTGTVAWHSFYGGGTVNDNQPAPAFLDVTSDGGYYIAGNVEASPGNYNDFFILRTNATGGIVWDKRFGSRKDSPSYSDIFFKAVKAADGGIVMIGYIAGYDGEVDSPYETILGPVQTSQVRGYWAVKINTSGNIQWQQTYPVLYGSNNLGCLCFPELKNISVTSDGGFLLDFYYDQASTSPIPASATSPACTICTGCYGFSGTNNANTQIRVIKLNSSGSQLWSSCLGAASVIRSCWVFQSVELTPTETLVLGATNVVGNSGTVTGGRGAMDLYLSILNYNPTSTVSVEGVGALMVYPNPVQNKIKVIYKPAGLKPDFKLQITDVSGRPLLNFERVRSGELVDLSSLPSGVYFATVLDGVLRIPMRVVVE